MSIKIIGGVAKGFSLDTPPESITRPTSVLLRRRLFDYYQNLSGYYFIDICSGSGSVALEAASRGANPVLCLETNEKAFNVLKKNCKNFILKFQNNLDCQIDYKKEDFQKWFVKFESFYSSLDSDEKKRVILFFDPPYEKISYYDSFFELIKNCQFQGIAITEACRQKTMSESDFSSKYGVPARNYRQGTSFLNLYDYN